MQNLLGISALGQQDDWPPLEAKHRVTGDVTLKKTAKEVIHVCTDLDCDRRFFVGGSKDPGSWQVS